MAHPVFLIEINIECINAFRARCKHAAIAMLCAHAWMRWHLQMGPASTSKYKKYDYASNTTTRIDHETISSRPNHYRMYISLRFTQLVYLGIFPAKWFSTPRILYARWPRVFYVIFIRCHCKRLVLWCRIIGGKPSHVVPLNVHDASIARICKLRLGKLRTSRGENQNIGLKSS